MMEEKIYLVNRANQKKEVTLERAQEWLKFMYDNDDIPAAETFLWPHAFRLRRLNTKLRGITAEELWETLPKDESAKLLADAEDWRKSFKETHRTPSATDVWIQNIQNGEEVKIPMGCFTEAIDRIAELAWKASLYNIESGFDWINGWYVLIHPSDMKDFPIAQTAPEIFRHLQHYGIMLGFEDRFGRAPQKCETIHIEPKDFNEYRQAAREAGVPVFRYLWKIKHEK